MKRKNMKWFVALTVFVSAAFFTVACDDAKNSAITHNQAYIQDGFSTKYQNFYADGTDEVAILVPVKMTHKDDTRDVKVKLEIAEDILEAFNERYDKEYVMYPKSRLGTQEVTIEKGTVGVAAELFITPLTKEEDETGNIYAVPVKITSTDGIGVMKGSESFIYLIKRTPRATVLTFEKTPTNAVTRKLFLPLDKEKLGNQLVFSAYTMEFLIKVGPESDWSNGNNYDLFNPTIGPAAGEIYTRIEGGSAGLDKANFNVKFNGDVESIAGAPSGGIKFDTWYHVAFVFGRGKLICYVNGVIVSQMDVTLSNLDFTKELQEATDPVGFLWGAGAANSGYGTRVRCRTQSAELRLWNVARTADQIRDNMYNVRADSEGLLGYWKLNDGDGRYAKDYTGKNPDGYIIRHSGLDSDPYSTVDQGYDEGYSWDNSDQVLTVGVAN